jgi:two-component system, LytTR family, sensor histidine kinase AlgZ
LQKGVVYRENKVVGLLSISASGISKRLLLFCFVNQKNMDITQPNNFMFSSKFRVWRHAAFWLLEILLIAFAWSATHPFLASLIVGLFWLPVYMAYCYPFIYLVLPRLLLKGRYVQFGFIALLWILAGWFVNYYFRLFVMFPVRDAMGMAGIGRNPGAQGNLFSLIAVWGFASTIALFKHWLKKQQEWLQAEKEKVTAELELLKAQVHPHFLFNTLNNIYSSSLTKSPQTPGLILKLSSLLSYMLYDCKAEQVLLEKEIEVMKDYVDLERERYGNQIEISWNIEGDIEDKYIAPLLLLPFLENAFKHGTSEQLEKPWLSFDLALKQNSMKCKVANSKNEFVPISKRGIGVENVKKRLAFLYPNKHELKINDEGDFFVVSLLVELITNTVNEVPSIRNVKRFIKKAV